MLSTRFSTCGLLAVLLHVSAPAAPATVIYSNNFDDDPVGTYTVANLKADWNNPSSNDGVDEGRVEIVGGAGAYSGRSLVVNYPQGESNNGKSQWKTDLGAGYDELYLSYRMKFGANFDFVRGGKLPGLAGGAANAGGTLPDGTDGWTARMMWRTNGSGGSTTNGTQSQLVQYVYHKDMPGPSGQDIKWDDNPVLGWQKIDSDVWYHFQHRVKMNTPGQDDGIIQAWLDGELVMEVNNLHFRDIASLKIDLLYFSTFFGGSSAPWEATKGEQAFYDDFVVSTTYIPFGLTGDLNGDGFVGINDLNIVLGAWNQNVPPGNPLADPSGDGFVGIEDLNFVLGNWNAGTPPAAAASDVPEPAGATLFLIAMSLVHVLRHR